MQHLLKYCLIFLLLASVSCGKNSSGRNSDMLEVGPGALANLVVYFRLGTSEDELEECYRNAIYFPRTDGRGEGLTEGYGGFLRLLPSQANNHEAIAITFTAQATEAQRRSIKESLESCATVYKIFQDIAPEDIKESDL
ncbi:MAG: hypothetical protein ABIV21_03805 [Pyrinomonadaceae bacterium]